LIERMQIAGSKWPDSLQYWTSQRQTRCSTGSRFHFHVTDFPNRVIVCTTAAVQSTTPNTRDQPSSTPAPRVSLLQTFQLNPAPPHPPFHSIPTHTHFLLRPRPAMAPPRAATTAVDPAWTRTRTAGTRRRSPT
jgi:hypothetical protein